MKKFLLIDAVHQEETRVVLTDQQSHIHEFDFTTASKQQIKGNVYLAKVTRVEPSLQAAFVEYGGGKQGFLPFSEIHADYYQIPVSDRYRLIAEAEDEAAKRGDDEASGEAPSAGDVEDGNESYSDTEVDVDSGETNNSNTQANIAAVAEPSDSVSSDDLDTDADVESNENATASDSDESEEQGDDKDNRKKRFRRRRGKRSHIRSVEHDNTDVETISGEEEIERPQSRGAYHRRYKIQEVVKRNQILLVQVIKEERGNKGVSLTTHMSLAGRYCVLMPNSPRAGGVSRKIGSGEDRKRLKKIIDDLELPRGMSVIIRTAGAQRTRVEIRRDFDYLVKLWNQIREETLVSSAPALVYEESNLIKRTIRDIYSNDIENIFVDGEKAYKEAKAFMKMMIPSHAPRVKLHKGNAPLFHEHGVEDQLHAMSDPVAKLRSGGYLVINPTEALIAIDVNSGRSTSERNVEETAFKTNVEAAKEAARQLKLRDLSGLIVIDFIDMMDGKNRRTVERTLKEALKADRAKLQIGRISSFGLLELSRQRLRPSINESMNQPCSVCNATGYIRSDSATAIQLIRAIEKDVGNDNIRQFNVHITPSLLAYMANELRHEIDALEEKFGINVRLMVDDSLRLGTYRIEKIRDRKQQGNKNPRQKPVVETEPTEDGQTQERKSRRRGGRRRNNRRGPDDERNQNTDNSDENSAASAQEGSTEGKTQPQDNNATEAAPSNDRSGDDVQEAKPRSSRRRGGSRRRNVASDTSETSVTPVMGDDTESEATPALPTVPTASDADEAQVKKPASRRRSTSSRSRTSKSVVPQKTEAVNTGAGKENSTSEVDISEKPNNKAEAPASAPVPTAKPATNPASDSNPANDDAPARSKRKGWWQKIID